MKFCKLILLSIFIWNRSKSIGEFFSALPLPVFLHLLRSILRFGGSFPGDTRHVCHNKQHVTHKSEQIWRSSRAAEWEQQRRTQTWGSRTALSHRGERYSQHEPSIWHSQQTADGFLLKPYIPRWSDFCLSRYCSQEHFICLGLYCQNNLIQHKTSWMRRSFISYYGVSLLLKFRQVALTVEFLW